MSLDFDKFLGIEIVPKVKGNMFMAKSEFEKKIACAPTKLNSEGTDCIEDEVCTECGGTGEIEVLDGDGEPEVYKQCECGDNPIQD